jgi:hypothetical protein
MAQKIGASPLAEALWSFFILFKPRAAHHQLNIQN